MSLDAETVATLIRSSDEAFIFGSAIVVLTMQGGFALLESAVVQKKNLVDILLKNLVDSIVCGLSFWLLGYGFAYGSSAGGVIGTDHFAMDGDDDEATELYNGINVLMHFFFQYTLVTVTATVISGAIAERVAVIKYSVFSTLMAAFVYPGTQRPPRPPAPAAPHSPHPAAPPHSRCPLGLARRRLPR